MIELATLARGATMLVLSEAAQGEGITGRRRSATSRKGAITQRMTDVDLAAALARFMAIERQCLESIGLGRRPRPVPSLRELLAAHEDQP